jgi:hypothetical protein
MIKVKHNELANQQLAMAFHTICSGKVDIMTAGRISRTLKKIEEARAKMGDLYREEIINKFSAKDEDGKIKTESGDPEKFMIAEEKKDELEAAVKAFGEKEVELDIIPFTPTSLQGVKLSAHEYNAIKAFLIEFPQAVNENVVPLN